MSRFGLNGTFYAEEVGEERGGGSSGGFFWSVLLNRGRIRVTQREESALDMPLLYFFFLGDANIPPCCLSSQGGVSRTGADHQGIHAWSDNHWSPLAGGICTSILQGFGSNQTEQTEEAAEAGTSVQPLRGAQRLENIARVPTPISTLPSSHRLLFWVVFGLLCPKANLKASVLSFRTLAIGVYLQSWQKRGVFREKAQGGGACFCQLLFTFLQQCDKCPLYCITSETALGTLWVIPLFLFRDETLRLRNLSRTTTIKRQWLRNSCWPTRLFGMTRFISLLC